MKNLYYLALLMLFCLPNLKAQKIILENTITEVNTLIKLTDNKAITSCKVYSPYAIVQPNVLKMYTVNNLTNFTLIKTIENLDSNLISWSHHAIFLNKPDTITLITNYLNTNDTTTGLAVLFLNYELEVLKKRFYKFNLPFKYPALKSTDIVPFNVKENGSEGYYGTTTIINSKNNDLWSIGAPVVEVLFDLEENLNLKVMKNIVSDSIELGDDFLFSAFNLLGLMKTNDGYRLQGENGLSFNLDSAFNVTNHTYTQPWESIWMPDGAISYHQTKSGYQSITMQVTDSSDFNGFPQNFTINTLNLLRLRKYDTNANLTDERISRLPNKYDSAFVRILKNDTVVYENNLKLSNPNLASFNSNNNGESIYGYYKVNNFLDLNEDNRYSLLLFDSAFILKNANNFYEEKTTLINSVLLENNGNIWVSGFQKGSIPTKNYLRLITKEEFYTGHKNPETHNKQLSIFPNPANNFIQLINLPNNCHVKIYNLSGKLVKSDSTINSSLLNVNIEEHECGIYFIDASTQNGETYRGKFVINR